MPWQKTEISVAPPSIQVGTADVETITFTAGEAITAATAAVTDLDATVPDTLVVNVTPGASSATVTVSGFLRGHTYELAVTFTRTDGRKWTRTLVMETVA